jgi:exodeoxyribonuclease VII small subunit
MSDMKFEDALQRLEQIVDQLETGKLSLEDSLKVYEEGIGLVRRCTGYLDATEKRIELLTRDDSGVLRTQALALDEDEA